MEVFVIILVILCIAFEVPLISEALLNGIFETGCGFIGYFRHKQRMKEESFEKVYCDATAKEMIVLFESIEWTIEDGFLRPVGRNWYTYAVECDGYVFDGVGYQMKNMFEYSKFSIYIDKKKRQLKRKVEENNETKFYKRENGKEILIKK